MSNVVVCTKCGERLFTCAAIGRDCAASPVRADDFAPLGDFPPPKERESMDCPMCGRLFAHPIGKGQLVLKLEGDQWWPHPPLRK